MKKLLAILLLLYTCILIYWMFFGFSRFHSEVYRYNLEPFSTIKLYFTNFEHFPLSTWLINMGGNIGVFIPFGILLPVNFPKLQHFLSFLSVFLIGITTLETCQLLYRVGSFDVDDILLNTVGALIGFILYRLFRKLN